MMTMLNDFPDEILCDIFIYFNPFDAIQAFYNLNSRFNRLLKPFKTRIDFTNLSFQQFNDYIDRYLPELTKTYRIETIRLGNKRTPGQIELFNEKNLGKFFPNVRSVTIESARLEELQIFVEKYLLQLRHLNIFQLKIDRIRDEQFQKWTQLIVNSILSINSFEKLFIDIPNGLVLSRLSNQIRFDRLKNVRLNVTLITDLLLLLPQIPNVKIFFIRISWWTSADRSLTKMFENQTNSKRNLIELETFHLTIESILTFDFLHLEQLIERILNEKTSRRLTLNFKHCSNYDDALAQLFNGERWEKLLRNYSSLKDFQFFIRLNTKIETNENERNLRSFDRIYFRQRHWKFSQWKIFEPDQYLFFSIPYRQNQTFEMILGNNQPSQMLQNNFASSLSIDQSRNECCPLNNLTFYSILEKFLLVQHLKLIDFQMNFNSIEPFHRSTLNRLEIDKTRHVTLKNLLELFPLINRLTISFSMIINSNSSSFSFRRYDRIIDLTTNGILAEFLLQTLEFFRQFPQLRCFRLEIQNRRINDELLLEQLTTIIDLFERLIYFRIQLEKNFDEKIDLQTKFNGRIQMFFIEKIFDGVLIHFWF